MKSFRKLSHVVAAGAAVVATIGGVGVVAAVLGAGGAAPSLASSSLPALPSSVSKPQYGVLIADPKYAASDYRAGVRLAIVSVNWSQWEPSAGGFSASYQAQELSIINGYRAAGFTVGINPSLNTAPSWVTAAPGSTLVDQYGKSSTLPNYEFSAAVRTATGTYLNNLVSTLGSAAYYEIGYSTNAELQYPASINNGWWAFDRQAQGTAAGLPDGVGVSPMPGWVPGTTTWKGAPVTTAQVQNWYNWYIGADINFAKYEMSTIRSAGFSGYFQLKMPGDGANAWVYPHRIAADLAPESYDSYSTLNVGQVWQVVVPALAQVPGVVVDITSVGDESGTPADNTCQAADATANPATDASVTNWSSTRWLSYLARQNNLPVIGESTGNNSSSDLTHDLGLVHSCGLIGLQWAFDYQLYSGGYATISDYANALGVQSVPAVGLSMSSYTYSTRAVGSTSAPLGLTVENTGTAALHVASAKIANPAFVVSADGCTGKVVAPGATCTVSVTFTPQASGTVTAPITFTDDAAGGSQSVALTGAGTGPTVAVPETSVTPAGYTYGNTLVGATSPAQAFTLKDTGSLALAVRSVAVTGAAFRIASNTCSGKTLAVSGTCKVGVTFDPTVVGANHGTLTVIDSAGTHTSSLSGTGTAGAKAPKK